MVFGIDDYHVFFYLVQYISTKEEIIHYVIMLHIVNDLGK